MLREPEEQDETVMDRTMIERQRGGAVGGPARSGRDLQKRLKRALTLVYSATDADEGDEAGAPSAKKRKSGKYLNDVDIIWSVVDEELRNAIEEQPAKAPFLALKALRKSVRSNFLNLSEKTDSRTTLISQLVRARKQKRQLRKEVFACRSELAKSTAEAGERTREMNDWKKEVTVSLFWVLTLGCSGGRTGLLTCRSFSMASLCALSTGRPQGQCLLAQLATPGRRLDLMRAAAMDRADLSSCFRLGLEPNLYPHLCTIPSSATRTVLRIVSCFQHFYFLVPTQLRKRGAKRV